MSPEKDGCATAQIFDPCRVPIAIRSDDVVYNNLLFTGHEQLLLDSFVAAYPSPVVVVPLGSIGKRR
jgi:hypothetical protein